MTRAIRLEIAGATATECGACRYLAVGLDRSWCEQPAFAPLVDDLDDDATWPEIDGGKRLPECTEAEASQAATERDAAKWRRIAALPMVALPVPEEGDATEGCEINTPELWDLWDAIAAEVWGERE
jgi:hypothetical protein